jgi:hypothetical protein
MYGCQIGTKFPLLHLILEPPLEILHRDCGRLAIQLSPRERLCDLKWGLCFLVCACSSAFLCVPAALTCLCFLCVPAALTCRHSVHRCVKYSPASRGCHPVASCWNSHRWLGLLCCLQIDDTGIQHLSTPLACGACLYAMA